MHKHFTLYIKSGKKTHKLVINTRGVKMNRYVFEKRLTLRHSVICSHSILCAKFKLSVYKGIIVITLMSTVSPGR